MTQAVPQTPTQRSVLLVTPDIHLRERLSDQLSALRWQVHAARGGAEAMVYLEKGSPEAMILDHWLPDLDVTEFAAQAMAACPGLDLLAMDGTSAGTGFRSGRRHELLHALRAAQDDAPSGFEPRRDASPSQAGTWRGSVPLSSPPVHDGAAWLAAPVTIPKAGLPTQRCLDEARNELLPSQAPASLPVDIQTLLPDVVGNSEPMRALAALVRMVAPHSATVLIQGETGTGKELVAKAVHQLSTRSAKPFVVLNCAAIPEHLLEAELFGHTRGAFTGAIASRMGRIEAAHGGTLFLDEIGEMPLNLQAKMLRFLECGEIQRIGDNEIFRVDVRIVAATHQPLEANAEAKLFRLDLYHRLAAFPIDVPSLRNRIEDLPMLVEHFLKRLGAGSPRKSIHPDALSKLMSHTWNGNIRELSHALQRAVIFTGDEAVISTRHLLL